MLEDLVSHPILAPFNYAYLHHDGPDHRGMDVVCLFRPERFNPLGSAFIPPVRGEGMDQTREMLHLQGAWGRKDTLELFLVHFISRYRGSGMTATYRREQSARLAALMDSVYCCFPDRLVVAAGDFNNEQEAWSIEPLRGEGGSRDPDACFLPSAGESSYKYRGTWSCIDYFLVGGSRESFSVHARVFRHPSLLCPDLTHGGEKPFRTYEGYRYAGGFSDHLPVLLDISRSRKLAGSGQ